MCMLDLRSDRHFILSAPWNLCSFPWTFSWLPRWTLSMSKAYLSWFTSNAILASLETCDIGAPGGIRNPLLPLVVVKLRSMGRHNKHWMHPVASSRVNKVYFSALMTSTTTPSSSTCLALCPLYVNTCLSAQKRAASTQHLVIKPVAESIDQVSKVSLFGCTSRHFTYLGS